jgi:parallel beta-helix repeat protein
MKKLAFLLGIFSLMLFVGVAGATTYECDSCSSCQSAIDGASPGDIIQLNESINISGNECINGINVDNLTFDCQGNTITGEPDYIGIYVDSTNYVTVMNCNIYGFQSGIYLDYTNYTTIYNNTIDSTEFGIAFTCFTETENNVFYNNRIENSTTAGIRFSSTPSDDAFCNNNAIYNNIMNNSANFQCWDEDNNIMNSSLCIDSFNTSITSSTNIVDGSQIGGNFWAYPNGTGFSETCLNQNNDSFCDSSYNIDGVNTDYLPLTTLRYPLECDSCSSCTDILSIAQAGDTVYLNQNITGDNNTECILFSSDNVTFDCNGFTIDLSTTSKGVVFNNHHYDTVQNCVIRGHGGNSSAISASSGSNCVIKNNTISVAYYGVSFLSASSTGNQVFGNTIEGSTGAGILFTFHAPQNNIVYDNILNNTVNLASDSGLINFFNTTITSSTNIVGGSQIGGNYWAYPNGTGFSETCDNINNDSFCDSSYSPDGNNTDYLPLTLNYTYAPPSPSPSGRLSDVIPAPFNVVAGVVLGAAFIIFILNSLFSLGISGTLQDPKVLIGAGIAIVIFAVMLAGVW